MKNPTKSVRVQVFLFIVFLVILYYAYITVQVDPNITPLPKKVQTTLPSDTDAVHDIWIVLTKVTNSSGLTSKFGNLIHNLVNVSTGALKFHLIVDDKSQQIAQLKLSEVVYRTNKTLTYKFYDVKECTGKIADIVNVMTPFFSSKPGKGTYYSDALFYLSLGLYRIAPLSQKRAVLLDCDLYFKKDVSVLFDEFNRFKPSAIYGMAPELTPVYRHILHMYKRKHKTTFGEFYKSSPVIESNTVHPRGFQGYNSGVVLIDFERQRASKLFPQIIKKVVVQNMTEKYRFRGHLGDQDFYTLVGQEYPDLIQTLNCGLNRQLCTWWRDHGYRDIFDYYSRCDHKVVVLHGNCNTRIPTN